MGKIIQTWTYMKADRRIHGTLHTLPKQPPVAMGSQQDKTQSQIRSHNNVLYWCYVCKQRFDGNRRYGNFRPPL